ncbi:MAG: hypothetical protein N4A36_03015 [Candidatus Gracilibacteria bacterium]|nr:hypothetical protein [Candidatus Gracilibacteria bacterium]
MNKISNTLLCMSIVKSNTDLSLIASFGSIEESSGILQICLNLDMRCGISEGSITFFAILIPCSGRLFGSIAATSSASFSSLLCNFIFVRG